MLLVRVQLRQPRIFKVKSKTIQRFSENVETITLRELFAQHEPEQTVLDSLGADDYDVPLKILQVDPKTLKTTTGFPLPSQIETALDGPTSMIVRHYKHRPSKLPIVVSGDTIEDGNHRAMADLIKGRPTRVVDLDDLPA